MSEVVVFLGPTLAHAEASRLLPARYCGPAAQGDVYRAALARPWGIALIDGYFQRVPAVWHKEILFALSHGIHVFGSSSMGALRAAELHSFGMVGVGGIFHDFASGLLEDDDEVAITHAASQSGYRPLSDALVNIRATLSALRERGFISAELSERLLQWAKALHYPERSYEALCRIARDAGVPADQCSRLEQGCSVARVDAKQDDARSLLRFVEQQRRTHPGPFVPEFHFERTDAWEHAIQGQVQAPGAASVVNLRGVLEELGLAGANAYQSLVRAALAQALARAEVGRQGFLPDSPALQRTLDDLRHGLGLLQPADFEAWYAGQGLDDTQLSELLADEASLEWLTTTFRDQILEQLPRVLQRRGLWGKLSRRALEKERTLAAAGLPRPSADDVGLDAQALVTRYFRDAVRAEVPGSLTRYAQQAGFAGLEEFLVALRREYCFAQHTDTSEG